RRPPGATLVPYTTLFRSWHRPLTSPNLVTNAQTHCLNIPHNDEAAGASTSRTRLTCSATTTSASRQEGSAAPVSRMGRAKAKRRSEEHTSELQSRFDLVC